MKQLNKRVPLFLAIFIWVMFAVSLLWAVFVSLWFLSPADKANGAKPLVAIVTASLTTVGGIGAVAYLVMKFRERQDKEKELEQEEANQRRAVVAEADRKLNDAIEQLGSESPQVRLAGVYALADVADNYLAGYKQRVADIFCGYLRTDRSDQLIDGKFKDAAVESAIIKVIGEHLRKDRTGHKEKVQTLTDEQLWCDCSFDFRGATFTEPVLWEKTLWNKTADFSDSEFGKDLRFQRAKFAGDAWFGGASFASDARFVGARFAADAWFDRASFAGDAGFGEARFARIAWFVEASFAGDAGFGGASFAGNARFDRASFARAAGFDGASFARATRFDGASFAGDAWFGGASFADYTWFNRASFAGDAGFDRASFAGNAWFNRASFAGDAGFDRASFAGAAGFDGASFAGDAGFGEASFAGNAWFNRASFAGAAWFDRASFISMFYLEGITFEEAPKTEQLLLASPEAGTGFGDNWNIESYNDEWTLEKKTECLKEVYKRFYTALHDHPQKAEKLAGIQKTISENFPGVTLDFKILEAEAEKVLEHSAEYE